MVSLFGKFMVIGGHWCMFEVNKCAGMKLDEAPESSK